jgi:uridine phosphorylase
MKDFQRARGLAKKRSVRMGKDLMEDESISNPFDALRYCADTRKVPIESLRIPSRFVLTYQRTPFDCARNLTRGRSVEWLYGESQPFCVGQVNGAKVGVGRVGMGAPVAGFTLEEAIACGAKTIFEVGISGGIQPYLQPGDIVVVTEAIRDEGTSGHYFPPGERVESDVTLRESLVERLKKKGIKHFVGPVWTTDGLYRESRGKFRKFKQDGVLAVDMETSAVFAIAKYRNVRAASAQVISDVLTENGWRLAFGEDSVRVSAELLLKTVLETISAEQRA